MPRRAGPGTGERALADEWAEARHVCLRVALRYARDRHEAEDIAQEAIVRAWRCWSTLREPERRQAWLATIARNEALRLRARVRPDPVDCSELPTIVGDVGVAGVEDRVTLEGAIEQLADQERLILHMRYTLDLTQAAIAERLGVPEGTVKVRLHRVRAKLRRMLDWS